MSRAVFETDWLNTDPVYYNEATGAVSTNVNDVIDFANLEFDPEGFNGFLDRGYSAFGLTPVRHVKFLPPSSRLIGPDDGRLTIESTLDDQQLADRVEDRSSESEVLEMLRALVQRWESSVEGDIVIPTSGGYDSRLLNLMIGDKSRVRSFTFGVSERQWDSTEVTRARLLSATPRHALGAGAHRLLPPLPRRVGPLVRRVHASHTACTSSSSGYESLPGSAVGVRCSVGRI